MFSTNTCHRYYRSAGTGLLLGLGIFMNHNAGAQSAGGQQQAGAVQRVAGEKIFTVAEEMPQPPFDLMKYLSANIRYPEAAKKQNIEGRVVLQFVIDQHGNVGNIVIQRDIGGGCGEEAVRVVKNMPQWKPGRQAGEPVNVYYTLPVSFKFAEEQKVISAKTANVDAPDGSKIFTMVEHMPKPPVDLMQYLTTNLQYPEAASKAGIEGRVIAQFIVDPTGALSDINIVRGLHPDCDEEVIRVLKAMPAWQPGMHAGKPVRVYYTLPVSFKLKEDKAKAASSAQAGLTGVATASGTGLKLHPNPVSDEVKFYVRPEKAGTAQVFIKDMTGRELIQKRFPLQASGSEVLLSIKVDELPAGTYVLEQHLNGQQNSAKFVIRR